MRKSTLKRFEVLEDNLITLNQYILSTKERFDTGVIVLKDTCALCDTCGGIFLKEKMYSGKPEVRVKTPIYPSQSERDREYIYHPYYCIHCQNKNAQKIPNISQTKKQKTK